MATSPEYVRAALGAARTFSDLALDALREAVLLVDTRQHHKPVLLANAAAARFFAAGAESAALLDSCLYEWLRASEAEAVASTIAGLSRHQAGVSRLVTWRCAAGEMPVMTDFKLIDGAAGQRIVMLSFAAMHPQPELLFAIDKLPMDLLILDRNLKITYANAAAVRSSQFSAARLLGCSALSVSPTAALSLNVYRHALAGTAFQGEPVEFVSAGGALHWYEMRVQPLMSGPCVVGLLVVSTDVTERCLQARAQSVSERRLRALTDYAHDMIAVAGPEGEIQYVSGGVTRALGVDPVQRRWRNLFDPVHADDIGALRAAYCRLIAGESGAFTQEFRMQHADGAYRWFEATCIAALDNPLIGGVVVNCRDVTARKQAELQLRHSEELLRATTENAADTLMLLDADLKIRFANRNLGALTLEQMAGTPIERLVPAAAREQLTAKLRLVLEGGEAVGFEFEDLWAGETRYFENRAVRIEQHGVAGVSLSIRDITERKRLAREILEVSGRERQRIGRDLHDGLGQELTGIALMVRGLTRRLERECPGMLESTNEIVALVNHSIESTRCLARGLLPVSREQGGLREALQGLADRSSGQYGFEVRFSAEIWPEILLDETLASHLFRIAQEALTNAARHAQASVVGITLTVAKGQFRLKIADNGCGMANSALAVAGLGTKIMAHRAHIIGAKFEIMRNPGGGTIVQVTGRQPSGVSEV